MSRRKRPYPVSRLVEELLDVDPALASASDEVFARAFADAANRRGFQASDMPKAWSLYRARFKARANMAGKTRKRYPPRITNLLVKARQSALEAVADYNNPLSPFRSGSFIVHMHVAWTSLLLAVFLLRKDKPYYVDAKTGKPECIDGKPKWWSLKDCVKEFWKGRECATSKNIEFFIGLRNQIEHALMPELDLEIFGECQAFLINFESLLSSEFGDAYLLQHSLALSLQFSRLRHDERDKAARLLHSAVAPSVRRYVDAFRSALSSDILADMDYSFKVFLLPNTGNHRSKDALAVEWFPYDPNDPESCSAHDRIVALIKKQHIPVASISVGGEGSDEDSLSHASSLRATDDPSAPAVRVVRDGSPASSVLVHEKLSPDLFIEPGNILKANTLMPGGADRFVLGVQPYYRIYALREATDTSLEQAEVLVRAALWDMYGPCLFWFNQLPPEKCASILLEGVESIKGWKYRTLLRLVAIVGSEVLDWVWSKYQSQWGTWSQRPQPYWDLQKLMETKATEDRRLTVLRTAGSGVLRAPGLDELDIQTLLGNSALASGSLSASCSLMSEKPDSALRSACLELDFITYGREVQSRSPAICQEFTNTVRR